ncbi:hypothetical protein [Dyadobacter sp. 3J3]|uniref:hypothetical protein n=1 Tax=Dyadobacter sp. 3J3 TaxID=2606600 RepID=UPI00135C32D3|nr:hypothetical protein [Dyadobacter sp. 3J3]
MTDPRRKDKQKASARRVIVAECYKKGMTIRQTCEVVMKQMGLDKLPSVKAVFNDRHALLAEWRSERMSDIDDMVQLELQRIDDAVMVLWDAWQKSSTDHKSKFTKRKGELPAAGKGKGDKEIASDKITTTHLEQGEKEEINFGDPRYISEIRFQLIERRKLLGMYAPEKKELTGKNGSPLRAPITFLSAENMTDEQIEKFLNDRDNH